MPYTSQRLFQAAAVHTLPVGNIDERYQRRCIQTAFARVQQGSYHLQRLLTTLHACRRAVYFACLSNIAELAAAEVAAAHAAAGASAPVAPTAAALERVLEAAWGQ